jgi:hypothetical protein
VRTIMRTIICVHIACKAPAVPHDHPATIASGRTDASFPPHPPHPSTLSGSTPEQPMRLAYCMRFFIMAFTFRLLHSTAQKHALLRGFLSAALNATGTARHTSAFAPQALELSQHSPLPPPYTYNHKATTMHICMCTGTLFLPRVTCMHMRCCTLCPASALLPRSSSCRACCPRQLVGCRASGRALHGTFPSCQR